jgi:hypothetical protein
VAAKHSQQLGSVDARIQRGEEALRATQEILQLEQPCSRCSM